MHLICLSPESCCGIELSSANSLYPRVLAVSTSGCFLPKEIVWLCNYCAGSEHSDWCMESLLELCLPRSYLFPLLRSIRVPKCLDRVALVHRMMAICFLIEWQYQVQYLSRIDQPCSLRAEPLFVQGRKRINMGNAAPAVQPMRVWLRVLLVENDSLTNRKPSEQIGASQCFFTHLAAEWRDHAYVECQSLDFNSSVYR